MIAAFDCETTGRAEFRRPCHDPSQPRIVQLAALLMDDEGTERGAFSAIILPDGWTIPDEAAAIHGITTEIAIACGVPLVIALSMFNMFAKQADTIIAHNIDFDAFVTEGEFVRAEKTARFLTLKRFCTMKASTPLCRLPSKFKGGDFKWPKLSEAVKILLGKELIGAHDALADVRACAELYFHIQTSK